MVSVSTLIARGNLRRAYNAAVAAPRTLLAQLEVNSAAAIAAISSGGVIASTSADGHATSFSQPGMDNGVSPVAMAGMWEELLSLYDLVKSRLGANAADLAVRDEIMGLLAPCYESTNDLTELRLVGVTP